MLMNKALGAPVKWHIGARGERPDQWPARLVTVPEYGTDDRGNKGLVATIITHQTNLQGEPFFGERTVQIRFLFDRAEHVEALDGTEERPLSARELIALRQASVESYLNRRGAGADIATLMAAATASVNASAASQTPATPTPASAPAEDEAPKKPAK